MRRAAAFFALAIVIAACTNNGGSSGTGPTTAPGGGTPVAASEMPAGTMQTAAPSEAPGASAGGGSGGGLGGVDTSGLPTIPTAKMCTLLSDSEAAALLGTAVEGTPSGMTIPDLGTNCVWTGSGENPPTIKVEFNTLAYKSQVSIFKTGTGSQTFTVSGRPAIGVEAPGDTSSLFNTARLAVSLGDDPKATALWVEAPTLEKAKKVAEEVLPRIGSLK
jgi:hypothetical protein